ncbi:hypothetical protein [Parapedobacter sp. 10938]|uniref:hypothetical protein n=1 Tax=Parapedobacter flavus TaxID=3110225 RepID=UPI002DB91202|nr:hypothetical protein [Parapedobacter sp. 10938]MEC3881986.1 hypothetical protein [Parapedobacter sp. 10938]
MKVNAMLQKWNKNLQESLPYFFGGPQPQLNESPTFDTIAEAIKQNSIAEHNGLYHKNFCILRICDFEPVYRIMTDKSSFIYINFDAYIRNDIVDHILDILTGRNDNHYLPDFKASNRYIEIQSQRENFFIEIKFTVDFLKSSVCKSCNTLEELKHKLLRKLWHSGDTFIFENLAFMNVNKYETEWYVIKDGKPVGTINFNPFKEIGKHDELFYFLIKSFLNCHNKTPKLTMK